MSLKPLGSDIWIADGPDITGGAGFVYPTRMAVIRLQSGGLFVWSPVELGQDLKTEIDALGPVAQLVAPNALHHAHIGDWRRAYPDAGLHGAPGLAAKRKDLALDTELGETSPPEWATDIDQAVLANAIATEVVFFHKNSGTVLFTDLIQHLSPDRYRGWRALVARLDLITAPEPSVPRKFRLAITDRKAARAALAKILDWPIDTLVMAHGAPVRGNGKPALVRAFAWLGTSR